MKVPDKCPICNKLWEPDLFTLAVQYLFTLAVQCNSCQLKYFKLYDFDLFKKFLFLDEGLIIRYCYKNKSFAWNINSQTLFMSNLSDQLKFDQLPYFEPDFYSIDKLRKRLDTILVFGEFL